MILVIIFWVAAILAIIAFGLTFRKMVDLNDKAKFSKLAKHEHPYLSVLGITCDIFRATDGTVSVYLDTDNVPTNERGPQIRVYLNGGSNLLWNNPINPIKTE